jgi:hypothetical protein
VPEWPWPPLILFNQVKQALSECNILTNNIRGQSHDSAAVMKGEVKWLQELFINISKYIKHVPSAPNSLKLMGEKAVSTVP